MATFRLVPQSLTAVFLWLLLVEIISLARGEHVASSLSDVHSPEFLESSARNSQVETRLRPDVESSTLVNDKASGDSVRTDGTNALSLRRHLAPGDFQNFNDFLVGSKLFLPDTTVEQRAFGIPLILTMTNLTCTNLRLEDILLTFNISSSQSLFYQINIIDLDLDCFLDYQYDYGRFGGVGNAETYTVDNDVTLALSFQSTDDFARVPPSLVAVESCLADFTVTDVELIGDQLTIILEILELLIRGTIERQIEDIACTEFNKLADGLMQTLIDEVTGFVEQYSGELSEADKDPLAAEKTMVVPDNVVLIDLLGETNDPIGKLFTGVIDEASGALGALVDDLGSPTGTGQDRRINVFMRDFLLNEERALVLTRNDLPFDLDILADVNSTVGRLKIFGLDTFTNFTALEKIGNYTVQTRIALEYLRIQLDLDIGLSPNAVSNGLLEVPGGKFIREIITIDLDVNDIEATVSLLLAADEDKLGSLHLGPLLDLDSLLNCLQSAMFDIQMSGLEVSIGNITEPNVEGLTSPGLDRVLMQTVQAFYLMYQQPLLDAVPNLFATTIRDVFNDFLGGGDSICPILDFGSDLIDFRDLLLEPDTSATFGGSGQEPYGSLGPTLFNLLQDEIRALGDDGLPRINSRLLRPFMASQSGDESLLSLDGNIFKIVQIPVGFELALYNARVRNVDTITAPISVIEPMMEPLVLSNALNLGPVDGRPLNATVGLLIALESDDSPFIVRNELDISIAIDSSSLNADVLGRIGATRLMQFPLRDLLNIDCLLSVFETPELDVNGVRVNPNDEPGLALTEFLLTLATLSLNVQCVSCTSPGVEVLPALLQILDTQGSFLILRERIEMFASEILLSDGLIQPLIDRLLSQAPRSCPHRPEYDASGVSMDFDSLKLPYLSRDAVETIIYFASVGVEVGLVVFAESHVAYDPSSHDFLSGQKALEVPNGAKLFNLLTLRDRIGDLFNVDLTTYLGETVEDIGGPNGDEDLRLNVIMRDLVLDDDGILSLGLGNAGISADEMSEMTIKLEELRVHGLDSFTVFKALDPVSNQTVRSVFGLRELDIEVKVFIQTPEKTGTLSISLGVGQLEVALSLLLAIDEGRLGDLELGSLLWIDQLLPCLFSSAVAAEVTELAVSVGDMQGPTVNGFLSDFMESAIMNVTAAIFDENNYRERFVGAVPGMFNVALRAAANNWIKYFLEQETSLSCPAFASERMLEPTTRLVDLRDLFLEPDGAVSLGGRGDSRYGDVFRALRGILNDRILEIDSSGLSALNDLVISPFTKSQSGEEGTLAYEGDLLNASSFIVAGGLEADFQLGIYSARVENLNSLGEPLSVLDPISKGPHELNNTASLGTRSKPLRFAATILFALEGKGETDTKIRNEVHLSVDLTSVNVLLGILLKIAESPFVSFPLKDIANVHCWLATLPAPQLDENGIRSELESVTAGLSELAFALTDIQVNFTCISCSGESMQDFTELISSPDNLEDVNRVVQDAIALLTDFLSGEFLQVRVDRLLADAARRCPHNDAFEMNFAGAEYEPFELEGDGGDSQRALLIVAAVSIVAALLILLLLIRYLVRRRHAKWLRSLPGQSVLILHREQNFQAEKEAELNQLTEPMFHAGSIPRYVRWLIPVVILGNIAFFLSGHLSVAGSIVLKAELADQEYVIDDFFEFSIATSVFRIFESGGYSLSILLFLFSIVWPYTKQFITLALWFLPPTKVSASRRGTIFLWLDALAKWSMVDVFILMVTVASFRLDVKSPSASFLPPEFYSISAMLVPMWGLYANMIAQLISQVSSHFIIYYHRRVVSHAKEEHGRLEMAHSSSDDTVSAPERLCDRSFARPHRGESDKLRAHRMVTPLLVCGAMSMTILVIIGCILPTFSIDLLGIIGLAVESGQAFEEAKTEFDVFAIVNSLMEQARLLGGAGDYIGLGTMSALLIVTVLIIPLGQSIMLLRQWLRPLNDRQHLRNRVVIEVLSAWQYAEVFVLSAVLAAWQLGPISKFMLNEPCQNLETTFASLVFFGVLTPEDAVCFKIDARVEAGAFVLISGAIILELINTFVNKAFFQYQRDKTEATILSDDPRLSQDSADLEGKDSEDSLSSIHATPVLFTDTFRWLLVREDTKTSKRAAYGGHEKLGDDSVDWTLDPSGLEAEIAVGVDSLSSAESDTASLSPRWTAAQSPAIATSKQAGFEDDEGSSGCAVDSPGSVSAAALALGVVGVGSLVDGESDSDSESSMETDRSTSVVLESEPRQGVLAADVETPIDIESDLSPKTSPVRRYDIDTSMASDSTAGVDVAPFPVNFNSLAEFEGALVVENSPTAFEADSFEDSVLATTSADGVGATAHGPKPTVESSDLESPIAFEADSSEDSVLATTSADGIGAVGYAPEPTDDDDDSFFPMSFSCSSEFSG